MDIQKERTKRNLTRQDMAEILGVSYRTIDAWENGRRNPSKQVIMLIEGGALDVKGKGWKALYGTPKDLSKDGKE